MEKTEGNLHALAWYDEIALDIAATVLAEHGVALNEAERVTLGHSIYRLVIDAKVRAALEKQ